MFGCNSPKNVGGVGEERHYDGDMKQPSLQFLCNTSTGLTEMQTELRIDPVHCQRELLKKDRNRRG